MSVVNCTAMRRTTKNAGETSQDDLVMGTNSSSIVSKRSVERLYYPNEPHFLRYFIRKPQRRSPLINRGYWLRMKLVTQTVQKFLRESPDERKLVVNLGCGYDPLPWQLITVDPDACKGAVFVDIDFPELLLKKRNVVQNTKELSSLLSGLEIVNNDVVLLRSDQYIQIGCDLRSLTSLAGVFAKEIGSDQVPILFVAEVSIAYMDVLGADCLIEWAATFSRSRFCLLEQILPRGRDYPFAHTMLAHFRKLRTPLNTIEKYPTASAQHNRFASLGWVNIQANSLWNCWNNAEFISVAERNSLNDIEQFDEWEDFAIFASHYVLLLADNVQAEKGCEQAVNTLIASRSSDIPTHESPGLAPVAVHFVKTPNSEGWRRFGASLMLGNGGSASENVANLFGIGITSRTNTYDVYARNQTSLLPWISQRTGSVPQRRMCFTITDLGVTGALLLGGRTSPDQVLGDCWVYHKWVDAWERIEDIPQPRYRHGAVALGQEFVLVSTGRISSQQLADEYYLWSRPLSWVKCRVRGTKTPLPTYGATFIVSTGHTTGGSKYGLLAGGLSVNGLFQASIWEWRLDDFRSIEPTLVFNKYVDGSSTSRSIASIARFGAAAVNFNDKCYIFGGIANDGLLSPSDEICVLDLATYELRAFAAKSENSIDRVPLLIGVSVVFYGDSFVIMGGGVVCFSFGSYWNKGCFTISTIQDKYVPAEEALYDASSKGEINWKFICSKSLTISPAIPTPGKALLLRKCTQEYESVARVKIGCHRDFEKILEASRPTVVEGLDFGSCTQIWTVASLKDRIEAERQVVVHEASSEHMNFMAKNFKYARKSFHEFLEEVESGKRVYLRSLSSINGADIPANFWKDFPSIAADFEIPAELKLVETNCHSSVLRISGAVTMWLHYDIMANILCQVYGVKRLLLFPPCDVRHFEFEAGASSSQINVFADVPHPSFLETTPHEAILKPGDVLYIPPLWLHSASPEPGASIAVNVFFRQLRNGYAAGRDVYGNRDLQPYENGRVAIAKIVESFRKTPADVQNFYLQRLAAEFVQMIA